MAKDSFKHVETMIGEEAVVRGDIILEGGVILSGKIYGNVRTNGPVRVTRTGYIKGHVTASSAFVGGTVEGNLVTTGKVVLGSDSVVKGDIVYQRLVIEEGAYFEGRCDIVTSDKKPPADRAGMMESGMTSGLHPERSSSHSEGT